jgi:hypothetical protein
MSKRTGQPPTHGKIAVSTLPKQHAKKHLAAMTASMNEVHDYGAHGEGQSSRGSFASGGASGADYSTTSTGGNGDTDCVGPSEY